ncbi:MAG: serine hydrolase, partial [Lentisphaeria bacterium]|nr:serine hydrolase [Lentisphaeria bacterium]
GWGLSLTTDDLAKFAQLLLQHGQWNGQQILPTDYLAEATVKQADNSMNEEPDWKQGYGYQFWISRHGYRGDGASGQLAVILEDQELCIAVTSCLSNMQNLLNVFWDELIPYLKSEPLPEEPEAYRELQEYIADLKIQPQAGRVTGKPVNACFRFQENPAGIRQCDVSFGENCCSLSFLTSHGPEQLRAGFGHFEYSVLQLTDTRPHRVAAYAVWLNSSELEIYSFICDGIYRDIWTINFSDPEEPLKNRTVCGCFRPTKPRLQAIPAQ